MEFSLFSPSTWSNPLSNSALPYESPYASVPGATSNYFGATFDEAGNAVQNQYGKDGGGDKYLSDAMYGIGKGFADGNGKGGAPAARGSGYSYKGQAMREVEGLPKFSRSGPASMVSTQDKLERFVANLRAQEGPDRRTAGSPGGEGVSIGGRMAASRALKAWELGKKYGGS